MLYGNIWKKKLYLLSRVEQDSSCTLMVTCGLEVELFLVIHGDRIGMEECLMNFLISIQICM